MTVCLVSFDTGTLTGAVLPNATIAFESLDAPVRAVGVRVAPSDRYTAAADANGQGSVTLAWGNWKGTMIAWDGTREFAFTVPQAASARLETLIGAPLSAVYTAVQISVLAAGGRGLYETPAAGRAATNNGDVFLAPLSPTGVGIYRRDSASVSPQIGSYFSGEATATPTDITPGRLTKVGDFGIGGDAIAVTNLNAITANGLYQISLANAVAGGAPYAEVWEVQHFGSKNTSALQVATLAGTTTVEQWKRHMGTTWGPWQRVRDTIEWGNASGGTFVRFGDGTQVCWSDGTLAIASRAAGSFTSATWIFPAAFASGSLPLVQVSARSFNDATGLENTARYLAASAAPQSITASLIGIHNRHTAAVSGRLDAFAIGRWF